MSLSKDQDALFAVSSGINKFAAEFYKNVSEHEESNLICSPISVSMVLSMALFGARGNTEKQLRSALNLPDDDVLNKSGIQSMIDILNAVEKVELRLANKLFIHVNSKITPEYEDITNNTFRSVSQNVDFRQTIEAAQSINSWAEKNTNNRIKNIVQPGDLAGVSLVLINAVYFKGNWLKKFDENITIPKTFHVNNRTTKEVPMMRKRSAFNYGNIDQLNAKYIELPYESNDSKDAISMFVILPNDKDDGLIHVEKNLHHVDFKKLHENRSVQIDLQLPKFKIESQFDLGTVLRKMGMTDMFESSADFSAITGSPDLVVSKVIQKAFLEVNEQGSEAAAVTAVMMLRCSMPLPVQEFIIDRPFICVIAATHTGVQLFNARVVDPAAA